MDRQSSADKMLEALEALINDIPLILAAVGANDNRLELEIPETSDIEIPNENVSGVSLEPVAAE